MTKGSRYSVLFFLAGTLAVSVLCSPLPLDSGWAFVLGGASLREGSSDSSSSSTVLPTPEGFTSNSVTETSVTLSWTDVEGETCYRLYRDGTLQETLAADTVTATVNGLTGGVDYQFELEACNGDSCSPRASLRVTTIAWEKVPGCDAWEEVLTDLPAKYDVADVQILENRTIVCLTTVGRVFFSTDGGHHFRRAEGIPSEDRISYGLYFFSELEGLIVGTKGAVWRTEDGGKVWTRMDTHMAPNTNIVLRSVSFVGDVGFAVGNAGTILRSLDRGRTWEKYSPTSPEVLPSPPQAPQGFAVVETFSTRVTLTWTDGEGETSYRLYKNDVLEQTLGADVHRVTVSGLTPSTDYVFHLEACNDGGCSPRTSQAVATSAAEQPFVREDSEPPPSGEVPEVPQDFATTEVTHVHVALSWTDVEGETSYKLYKDGVLHDTLLADVVTATVGELAARTTYAFELEACNDVGCSPRVTLLVTTAEVPIPSVPSNFKEDTVTPFTVVLSWTDVEGETRYNLYKDETLCQILGADVVTTTVDHLTASKTYTFELEACNDSGCSEKARLTVATPMPTDFMVGLHGLDALDRDRWVISGSAGAVFQTLDRGERWTRLNIKWPHRLNVISYPSERVIVAGGYFGTVYFSVDGGATWSLGAVPNFKSEVWGLGMVTEEVGFLVSDDFRIYKTYDRGRTWEAVTKITMLQEEGGDDDQVGPGTIPGQPTQPIRVFKALFSSLSEGYIFTNTTAEGTDQKRYRTFFQCVAPDTPSRKTPLPR